MSSIGHGFGREPGRHLDEDEFGLAMMGESLGADAQAHVDGCAECRAEMELFTGSVGNFGLAALRWSEAQRPAAMPQKAAAGWRMYPAAGWALAAAVLLGVMVPVTVHFQHGHSAVETAADTGSEIEAGDSAEQIAKDNALLAAVDDELSQSEAQMLAAHGWQAGSASGAKTGLRERRR
ncbi:hypothetical protein [Granulicella tundricola]|uniref:Zinc-finger domain-containing protein n=1 Tax=Granulicella tundricola (strain ATCC BAA-1859 / DSM 23138 / MP5ACTX9) TaxID=1198114 RepID=E8WVK2_GRATM|nr:hypothetical protein [Granulicella tundricola]ADW69531.1 hypothetical protein AciX9_2499 [Granulicella tundricola MP5ACTX9]